MLEREKEHLVSQPAPARLPRGEVHVFLSDPDAAVASEDLASCHALLSEGERARLAQLALPHLKRIHMLTRALVRTSLSRCAAGRPETWEFVTGEHGKPALADHHEPLEINISHTQGLISCAIARGVPLGIDVEDIRRRSGGRAIAERYFAPAETAALAALSVSQQQERFLELWTLKEAYIKARGSGLTLPLKQFSYDLDSPATIGLRFEPSLTDDPDNWQLWLLAPTPHHRLALAVRRGRQADLRLRLFWSAPGKAVREIEVDGRLLRHKGRH